MAPYCTRCKSSEVNVINIYCAFRFLLNDIKLTQSRKRKQKEDDYMIVISPPSEQELEIFYEELNKANKKPAILKITKPYHKEYIPKATLSEFPMPTLDLYNPDALSMPYIELLAESEKQVKDIKV